MLKWIKVINYYDHYHKKWVLVDAKLGTGNFKCKKITRALVIRKLLISL